MSKYDTLANYLRHKPGPTLSMSFAEIERVLGEALPKSARTYQAWWSSKPSKTNQHVHAVNGWHAAGWVVDELSLSNEQVVFRKVTT